MIMLSAEVDLAFSVGIQKQLIHAEYNHQRKENVPVIFIGLAICYTPKVQDRGSMQTLPEFFSWILNPYVLVPLLVWSIAIKGLALWYAARGSQKVWFVALLVMNTIGILETIYIKFFRKKPI
jgi:hypothetical protein